MNLDQVGAMLEPLGWEIVDPVPAAFGAGGWTFFLAEDPWPFDSPRTMVNCSLSESGTLSVVNFDGVTPVIHQIELDYPAGTFDLPAALAEALSGNRIEYAPCDGCALVRQVALSCEQDRYCPDCQASHYFHCTICLSADAEPERV